MKYKKKCSYVQIFMVYIWRWKQVKYFSFKNIFLPIIFELFGKDSWSLFAKPYLTVNLKSFDMIHKKRAFFSTHVCQSM